MIIGGLQEKSSTLATCKFVYIITAHRRLAGNDLGAALLRQVYSLDKVPILYFTLDIIALTVPFNAVVNVKYIFSVLKGG